MNVLVCGATGCIGSAVTRALRWRGHHVVAASRTSTDGADWMSFDFMRERTPAGWATALAERRIDAVVNCVGILLPDADASFARVHTDGPVELFRGAALAGVGRVVQVSALGVGAVTESGEAEYLRSKRLADEALLGLTGVDAAIVRPSLVFGPGSASAALFATLASLPVIGLPGAGRQRVQPIHVFELAEIVAGLVERTGSARGIYELGGEALDYRRMLATYRRALGLGEAIWLPVPMPLMALSARLAERVAQRVFSRDTLRLLARGNMPACNAAPALLGRAPSRLDEGLAVTPPRPLFDLRVDLAPPVERVLRFSLACLWVYTAVISAWLPERSGVLELLARCGFAGAAGQAALAASCALNLTLGMLLLLRPSALLYAVQAGAVVGYTLTAAFHVPALTIDHCAPLVKNLPVLACVVVLWLAEAGRPSHRAASGRGPEDAALRPPPPSPRFRPATRDAPA